MRTLLVAKVGIVDHLDAVLTHQAQGTRPPPTSCSATASAVGGSTVAVWGTTGHRRSRVLVWCNNPEMDAEPQEPGWYADPHGEAAERRWDGKDWLNVTRGHAGDGMVGKVEHVTDLDYLEALVEQMREIRGILKFWGVVFPITFGVLYLLLFLSFLVGD